MSEKKVLVIFYSYTHQTWLMLKKFIEGMESEGVSVTIERLEPLTPYEFPFRSNLRLFKAMVQTFFQKRDPIAAISQHCHDNWDCIVLAGPTWSYFPSGPMLSFLDVDGQTICAGKAVLPFISCRSYWRLNCWMLSRKLRKTGCRMFEPIVFNHPISEPYRFIGLLLQLRGKMIRREKSWFRKKYPGYGHSRQQGEEALAKGKAFAHEMLR